MDGREKGLRGLSREEEEEAGLEGWFSAISFSVVLWLCHTESENI